MHLSFGRLVVITLILVLSGISFASSPNVGVVRISSLDSLTGDVARLAGPDAAQLARATLSSWLGDTLGIADISWIDDFRPIVVVFPLAGMALGEQGMVGAFPVKDAEAALGLLRGATAGVEADEQGVLSVPQQDGSSILLTARGGYLIAARNRELLSGFDPQPALAAGDLPPGNFQVDLFLEALAPMAQMGLVSGRQMLEQDLAEDAEAQETGDAESSAAYVGLGFDFLQDLLNNTSRLQFSFEVAADDVILHSRALPKAGSTLAGLLAAQEDGLPDLARHLDPSVGIAVGRVKPTPEFLVALQYYVDRYMEAIGETLVGENEPEDPWLTNLLGTLAESSGRWQKCYRGDFAWSAGLSGDRTVQTRQIIGTADADACMSLIREIAGATAKIPAGDGETPLITVTENALTYRDVVAMKQETDLGGLSSDSEEPEATEWMQGLFGGNKALAFLGLSGNLVLSTSGPGAESDFKALVDRVSSKKTTGGIRPTDFEPLRTGAGLFFAVDVAAALEALPEPGETEDDFEELRDLREVEGRVVYGARLEPGAIDAAFSMPVALLTALIEASSGDESASRPVETTSLD